jgi:PAS domain S-box-containing protein
VPEPGADIVVVGNGELVHQAVRTPLEEAGHRVRTVTEAIAALAALRHQLPDVVISEWQLPRLDGLGLCRAVRADPELSGTHVIVMTNAADRQRAADALDAGADDYLATPFEPAELLARVCTGRRTAQLRASEARLRALMANVPGAIYRCAPDSDWTMELISDEIQRISGYPPEDFIDSTIRTFASIIHPDDRERVEDMVFEACEAGRPFVLEYRIVRADGAQRWVLERGQLVHGTNGRRWLDGAIFDISVRREAEEGRRRREAEQARVAELRASRARIIEAADAARRQIERDLHDGAQQHFLAVALQLRLVQSLLEKHTPAAAPHVAEVLDELLRAIAELRELARGIHPASLSERGLVRAVEALIRRLPMVIELGDVPEQRLPRPVETAFYYVIAEALTNAYKHAEANSISVDIARAGGRAWVEITDDGHGGARTNAGSGLDGLSDRLEALDGRLVIVSPPGGGTTVRAEVRCD